MENFAKVWNFGPKQVVVAFYSKVSHLSPNCWLCTDSVVRNPIEGRIIKYHFNDTRSAIRILKQKFVTTKLRFEPNRCLAYVFFAKERK